MKAATLQLNQLFRDDPPCGTLAIAAEPAGIIRVTRYNMIAPDQGVPSRLRCAKRLHRERRRDGPAQPQGLAVEALHRRPGGRKGPVDALYEIGKQTFVDRELPIGEELHQDGAQQSVVRGPKLDQRE